MDNREEWENEKCSYCNESLKDRVAFTNQKQAESGIQKFPEMNENESMHMECYFRHCIEKFINQEISIGVNE